MNSGPQNLDDLEDGEIFDDEDDQPLPPPTAPQPPPQLQPLHQHVQPLIKDETLLQLGNNSFSKRRLGSPNIDRKRHNQKMRRGKRNRDDDRLFQQRKKRRMNDEKPNHQPMHREKEMIEDNQLLNNTPVWDNNRFERSDGHVLDEDDEELCGPIKRGGRVRDFLGRQRNNRMRNNNRGGRRGGMNGPGNNNQNRRGGNNNGNNHGSNHGNNHGNNNHNHGNNNHGNISHGNISHGINNHGNNNHGNISHGIINHGSNNLGNIIHGLISHGSVNHGNYGNSNYGNNNIGNINPANNRGPINPPEPTPPDIKFFLQGKSQRDFNSTNSQQNQSNRKYELCKFYMNDCCSKKEKCVYMHNDFPCKYHHLGLKCYAGKRCKFSHHPVSPYMKQMLVKNNQTESDKNFLLQLLTRSSPGRGSPDFHHFHEEHEEQFDEQFTEDFFDDDNPFFRRSDRNRNHNFNQHRNSEEPERKHDRMPSQSSSKPKDEIPEDDGESSRTPMPSPTHDNSNDNNFMPEKESSPLPISSPVHDESTPLVIDESKTESQEVPLSLPKKQRELFMRIQQHQRQSGSSKDEDDNEMNKEDEYKEDDWYSSDDDANPLTMIMKTIKKDSNKNQALDALPALSKGLLDIDVNEVSKLLESIKQKGAQKEESKNEKNEPQEKTENKRRVRDPRLLKASNTNQEEKKVSSNVFSLPSTHSGDVDLRMGMNMDMMQSSNSDIDLRQLPFKPAPVHPPANEIDASINAHMTIEYVLKLIPSMPKPDYTGVQAKCLSDPRLKRFTGIQPSVVQTPNVSSAVINPFVMTGQYTEPVQQPPSTPQIRDPRQRAVVNDPRRKAAQPQPQPLLQHPPHPMHPFPMRDSDLRNPMYKVGGDIDLRFLHPSNANFAFK